MSALMQRVSGTVLGERYMHDLAFRGSVSLCQGMVLNFIYVVFRMIVGIRYASAWFISMAVYYLVLGILRLSLLLSCRHRDRINEWRCYRRTAWRLLLLNIPMGGMILLTVLTNSGYSYPGYIIYASALQTFYTMTLSIINLIKYHKLGSPVLSAAKTLNFIAALMSILGLQTAMIAQFSAGADGFRKTMNAATGSFVYSSVIFIAVYMLRRSRALEKKGEES